MKKNQFMSSTTLMTGHTSITAILMHFTSTQRYTSMQKDTSLDYREGTEVIAKTAFSEGLSLFFSIHTGHLTIICQSSFK